ncbi:MAG: FG-GAP-like repeat-containing protein, partial [Chloroflexi bacterium]|nr:FG-GAP-like repeat-containing protein [Chloroflexota bacterium]
SATTIACADVDNDGWADIYVGNLQAEEFRTFASASHPGHYNVLYRNNGDLTFTDVAEQAGVRGPQILMRDSSGEPMVFTDPTTGEQYEGWDPAVHDRLGNQVGDPTGMTHAVMFFDYDDDRDPDLFVADDGDRLKIYRNDSANGVVSFTQVADDLGLDAVGAWMGFTTGDYDGDGDLDVFVTNIGYHPSLRRPQERPNGSCEYHHQFAWGTCLNYLLRNDGVKEIAGVGVVGDFKNVAWDTPVRASLGLPPDSLNISRIYRTFTPPTGIAAYDFGFGATFFDLENDGDQDLYWLGSTKGRGEGPGGDVYPGVGRLLRGDGTGAFEDITVEAHMLDIVDVDYSITDKNVEGFDATGQRMSGRFHENGKGVAHGDLNGDGYVDIIGTNSSGLIWEGRSENLAQAQGPVFMWVNGNSGNHWLNIRLRGRMAIDGTGSNADGIGARVYVKSASGSDSQTVVQVQEVRAGSSYLSMDSIDLEFGVGGATIVEEITILWPSGREQQLTDVAIDQVLEIVEPQG